MLLKDILKVARVQKSDKIILNGDIFHIPRPVHEVMLLFQKFLVACRKRSVRVYINVGNHDYFSTSNPDDTFLDLFSGYPNVTVVNRKPYWLSLPDCEILIHPWRKGPEFVRSLRECVNRAKTNLPKVLIAHQPITEGIVNDLGITKNADLSVKDLMPEYFNHIFLNDYHEKQQLGDNIWYTGAPIPTKFGEVRQEGVVVMDKFAKAWNSVELPSIYAEFCTYTVSPGNLYIPGYNKSDYNRVKCPAECKAEVEALYPTASVVSQTNRPTQYQNTRLGGVDEGDSDGVLKKFLASRPYKDKTDRKVMKKCIRYYYKKAKESIAKR